MDKGFQDKLVKSSFNEQFLVISITYSMEYLLSLHLKN